MPAVAGPAEVERGRRIFDAGGCLACHTDVKAAGPPLAGGRGLKTPFGTFYAPNISPDPDFGIGRWTDADFLRAMQGGVSPTGAHYYPAFPYPTFTRASDRDLLDLKEYLLAQTPVATLSRPHEVAFPFSLRPLLWFWKLFNFRPLRWQPDPARSEAWNRGSYLVEALSHCGECHTPRNLMGGLDRARWMAGARLGDEKSVAPNLTPHASGLARWTARDIAAALEFGLTPEDEPIGGEMDVVVTWSTSRLAPTDRAAIATYLQELPALPAAAVIGRR
ncbi:MAG: hypothetical protein EXQ96_10565 [Alphaproteobacteria bacterium]|nr:hypothetical protein [Alphaproteobacteria bacterium]